MYPGVCITIVLLQTFLTRRKLVKNIYVQYTHAITQPSSSSIERHFYVFLQLYALQLYTQSQNFEPHYRTGPSRRKRQKKKNHSTRHKIERLLKQEAMGRRSRRRRQRYASKFNIAGDGGVDAAGNGYGAPFMTFTFYVNKIFDVNCYCERSTRQRLIYSQTPQRDARYTVNTSPC